MVGSKVLLRARLQNKRESGNKLPLSSSPKDSPSPGLVCGLMMISKQMVKFVNASIQNRFVLIEATVAAPIEAVKSCTVHDASS
jgi:aspartyl-tRNA synthetase